MSDDSLKKSFSRPTLVRHASDSVFPFIYRQPITDYLEPASRDQHKNHIFATLKIIDALDTKIIEHLGQFEIRFRYPFDFINYKSISMHDATRPIIHRFTLPDSRRKFPTEVWKLKKCFKQAIGRSGVQDNVTVRINEERSVVVEAKSIASYLQFWHHVPENRRRNLSKDKHPTTNTPSAA